MKRAIRWGLWVFIAAAMAAFRWVPGLAAAWQAGVALPALQALHRWTAGFALPLLEPLALGASCLGLGRRGWKRLRWAALLAAGMAALLWYPAYWARTPETAPAPDARRLEGLCVQLIGRLDASPLRFSLPYDRAGTAAGMPGTVVKAARYPEWMRAAGISGLFSPWTGEAIVDGGASPALLPFTCVHELMHLKGIADEGAANIAAYDACLRQGGMFADSARLWALRYALPMLRETDADAARRVVARMDAALLALLPPLDPPRPRVSLRLLGLERSAASYAALVDCLCGRGSGGSVESEILRISFDKKAVAGVPPVQRSNVKVALCASIHTGCVV